MHRLLAASLGISPLPESARDSQALQRSAGNMNLRHRNAQMAGRASVELHTLIFFKARAIVTDARVLKVREVRNLCLFSRLLRALLTAAESMPPHALSIASSEGQAPHTPAPCPESGHRRHDAEYSALAPGMLQDAKRLPVTHFYQIADSKLLTYCRFDQTVSSSLCPGTESKAKSSCQTAWPRPL